MAITWQDGRVEYEGCVLCIRERNGYHDSDFYAVVWDDTEKRLKSVGYASTRYAGGGNAVEDATPETIAKATEFCVAQNFKRLCDADKEHAREVKDGRRVRVIRGRKVKIGTEGVVFYMREQTFSPRFRSGYKQGPDAIKVGIRLSDKREAQYTLTREGDRLVLESPYDEEFPRWARAHGGNWSRDRKVWIFPVRIEVELRAKCDETFMRWADVAWTYLRNLEVVNPEEYEHGEAELRKRAEDLAARAEWHLPFVAPGYAVL